MLITALLIIILILLLIVLGFSIFHIFVQVPFVPSKQKVIEVLVELAELKPTSVVYDLGAGDARILLAAKKLEPKCTAIGYEFLPAVYIQGLIRIWWSKQQVQLHRASYYKANLRNATVVFCYLYPKEMKRLELKFTKELQPGTRVLSSMFRLPNKKTVATHSFMTGKRKRTVYEYVF